MRGRSSGTSFRIEAEEEGILDILALVAAVLVFPAVVDSFFTVLLVMASRKDRKAREGSRQPLRWLVLVPARREGRLVEPVLRALAEEAKVSQVRTVLILDGPDDVAADVARSLQAEVEVKTPEGPSKGAVLAWAANRLDSRFRECDAVLVLDVGSVPSKGFFSSFFLPAGTDAVQALLGGKAAGVGEAIRHSETFAQRCEDAGRESLGWNVRLRGTGTGFRPEVFRSLSTRLKTQVEDLEASLLLTAAGWKSVMGPETAVVVDEKPDDIEKAATQRARWLLGRWQLLVRQPGAFLRVLMRGPLEGVAFFCEIWGRPFVLSVAIRLLAGIVLGVAAAAGLLRIAFLGLAAAFVLSALLTAGAVVSCGRVPWRSVATLARSWVKSLSRLPSAVAGWLRAR
jgi:cellulose synthase/poly-beta-1,6-N-acetylglucosamine synthase-like glycosyltransferase